MKHISEEHKGELLVGAESTIYALFPIIVAYTTKQMPPILFAGMGTLVAGISVTIYLLLTGKIKSIFNREAIFPILGVTLFIIIIPSILIFTGGSLTSGINTSILLQSEIVFTFIIYSILKYEEITKLKILGAIQVIIGTTLIVYNGASGINIGDFLIIAGTFFYPIGNIFAKKALKKTTIPVILAIRNILGGIVLLTISLTLEKFTKSPIIFIQNNIFFILLSGILVYWISKSLWYAGLRRLDISKAILISVGGYPALSLLFAIVLLKEIPTLSQWIGFAVICVGIFFIIKTQRSKNIAKD